MDNFDKFLTVLVIGVAIMFFILGATNPIVKDIKYKTDTIYVHVPDSSLVNQIDSLCYKIDSLEQINSEYFTELTIATIKLERIRDYNRIAANGNNIKYLRGWINRTLED